VLAVEDCVTGVVYAASRQKDATTSSLQKLSTSQGDRSDVLQNGSIMRIVMKPFFAFEDLAGLTPVAMPAQLGPPAPDNT
jgi:hypothetical protein